MCLNTRRVVTRDHPHALLSSSPEWGLAAGGFLEELKAEDHALFKVSS